MGYLSYILREHFSGWLDMMFIFSKKFVSVVLVLTLAALGVTIVFRYNRILDHSASENITVKQNSLSQNIQMKFYTISVPKEWRVEVDSVSVNEIRFYKGNKEIGKLWGLSYLIFGTHYEILEERHLNGLSTDVLMVKLEREKLAAVVDDTATKELHFYFPDQPGKSIAPFSEGVFDLMFLTDSVDEQTALAVAESFRLRPTAVDIEKYNYVNAKAKLFKEAVDEFGAISPEQAANLWAKGVQNRNGALQYAVLDNKLKKTYSENMEKERPSWVTGWSSPWVESYDIVKVEKKNANTYSISVKFDMKTSAGSEGSHHAYLLIMKRDSYWVIINITMDDFLKGLTGYDNL